MCASGSKSLLSAVGNGAGAKRLSTKGKEPPLSKLSKLIDANVDLIDSNVGAIQGDGKVIDANVDIIDSNVEAVQGEGKAKGKKANEEGIKEKLCLSTLATVAANEGKLSVGTVRFGPRPSEYDPDDPRANDPAFGPFGVCSTHHSYDPEVDGMEMPSLVQRKLGHGDFCEESNDDPEADDVEMPSLVQRQPGLCDWYDDSDDEDSDDAYSVLSLAPELKEHKPVPDEKLNSGDSADEEDVFSHLEKKLKDTTFEDIAREQREKKATKADDAEVPEYLWQEHLINDADPLTNFNTLVWTKHQLATLPTLMNGLRKIGLKWWKKNVMISLGKWLGNQSAATKQPADVLTVTWKNGRYAWAGNSGKQAYLGWHTWRERAFAKSPLKVARDAIERTSRASWWTWDDGSTPLFWRWPAEYMVRIRDGVPVNVQQEPPRNLKPQRGETKAKVRDLVQKKLEKILKRRYITPGLVESLMNFFAVPKGEFDIRMVFDGTASGLDDSIWMPGFGLPMAQTHLRSR
jgi:hypothetical protein